MIKKLSVFSLFLLIVIVFGSCSRFKDIVYLRGTGYNSSDSLIKTTYNIYKVQAFDILYVRVTSVDEDASKIFNINSEDARNLQTTGVLTNLIGYTIDLDGFVNLPVIGKLHVAGLTLFEIESLIGEKVGRYLSDARVLVRLLSFKITLLGEINSGPKTISADRANIFEVFAMGGDINKYGNRHKVLILRTTPEGVRTYRIDVTKDDIIGSPFFYLQPNDLIYVEPMKSAAFRLSLSEYALFLSAITATVSTYFLIRSF